MFSLGSHREIWTLAHRINRHRGRPYTPKADIHVDFRLLKVLSDSTQLCRFYFTTTPNTPTLRQTDTPFIEKGGCRTISWRPDSVRQCRDLSGFVGLPKQKQLSSLQSVPVAHSRCSVLLGRPCRNQCLFQFVTVNHLLKRLSHVTCVDPCEHRDLRLG